MKIIPTATQLSNHFGMSVKTFYSLSKNGNKERLEIYEDAWFFNKIKEKANTHKEFCFKEPTIKELSESLNKSTSNLRMLKNANSKMFKIYRDAWYFRQIIKKLCEDNN